MSDERPKKDIKGTVLPSDRPEAESAKLGDSSLQDVHSQLGREKKEPIELYKPVPMALIFLFCFLFAWAGVYMTDNSGEYRSDIFDYTWRPGAEASAGPSIPEPGLTPEYFEWQMKKGRSLYATCQACHMPNGQGGGAFPPLAGSEWVTGDKERIIKIVLHGLKGEIEVLGKTYNNVMQPIGINWKDRDVAAVITYVRNTFGNEAEAVLPDLVAEVREATKSRTTQWTADEL